MFLDTDIVLNCWHAFKVFKVTVLSISFYNIDLMDLF